MRALRLSNRCFIKPRVCPDCNRICFIADWWGSQRCRECHKSYKNKKKSLKRRFERQNGTYKYTVGYQRSRKVTISAHPYCALCGCCENLTTHHIGGECSNERLTVLCDDCHQAYERWVMKGEK